LTKAQTASLQVIHNSPDAAATTVDIYAGSTLLINDLSFRNASQTFTNIPAGVPINVKMVGSLINNAAFDLYDPIGKLISKETVLNINTVLDVHFSAKGIYMVRIVTKGANTKKRIQRNSV
jgi:hypothetical protein